MQPMGLKGGRGQGTFIDSFLSSIDAFYTDVLQGLKTWSAKPPRMREPTDVSDLARDQDVTPALVSTALSSQDGVQPSGPPAEAPALAPA